MKPAVPTGGRAAGVHHEQRHVSRAQRLARRSPSTSAPASSPDSNTSALRPVAASKTPWPSKVVGPAGGLGGVDHRPELLERRQPQHVDGYRGGGSHQRIGHGAEPDVEAAGGRAMTIRMRISPSSRTAP